jgi:hypothetical protein
MTFIKNFPTGIRDERLNTLIDRNNGIGWVTHSDTQYTEALPLSIVADTDTLIPNNGLVRNVSQAPKEFALYDPTTQKIHAQFGDFVTLQVEFSIVPTEPNATFREVWLDTSEPHLHRDIFSFPKGQGIARSIHFVFAAGVLSDWTTTGARTVLRVNGTANIYDIVYDIGVVYKAR